MTQDYDIGMLVLVANGHYKAARWRTILAAWLFGEHRVFRHMGRRMRISFYREIPYLLTFAETKDMANG